MSKILHSESNRQAVAFARVLLFGFWSSLAALTPLADLALLPRELVLPTGIVQLFPESWQMGLWSHAGLSVVKYITVIACAGCALSWRAARVLGPIACLAATLFQCVVRSYGHINHGEVVALLSIYLLALFAWINTEPRIARWQSQGFNPYTAPLLVIALMLCMSYTLTGVQRVGLEVLSSVRGADERQVFFTDAMIAWVNSKYGEGSYSVFKGASDVFGYWPWLEVPLNAGLFLVTVMECTALLALTSRWYRAMFVIVMISFHLGSLVLLRIFFWENLILYVFFLDIPWWLGAVRRSVNTTPSTQSPPMRNGAHGRLS